MINQVQVITLLNAKFHTDIISLTLLLYFIRIVINFGITLRFLLLVHLLIILILQDNTLFYLLNGEALDVGDHGLALDEDIGLVFGADVVEEWVFQGVSDGETLAGVKFQGFLQEVLHLWGDEVEYFAEWSLLHLAKRFDIVPSSLVTDEAYIIRGA